MPTCRAMPAESVEEAEEFAAEGERNLKQD